MRPVLVLRVEVEVAIFVGREIHKELVVLLVVSKRALKQIERSF